MIKQIKILFCLISIFICGVLAFYFFGYLMYASMVIQGVASLVILLIFSAITFKLRNLPPAVLTVTVAVISFFAAFFDSQGNWIYNFPLEWIYRNDGTLLFQQKIYNYRPGEYSSTTHLILESFDGSTHQLSQFILLGYRFFQYLILFFFIGCVIRKFAPQKIITFKRSGYINQDILSKPEMDEVINLIKSGEKIKAIKLTMDSSGLSLSTCKRYVSFLEDNLGKK